MARAAGLRGPAAAQTRERKVRCMVANAYWNAEGWSLIRLINRLIMASKGDRAMQAR